MHILLNVIMQWFHYSVEDTIMLKKKIPFKGYICLQLRGYVKSEYSVHHGNLAHFFQFQETESAYKGKVFILGLMFLMARTGMGVA